MANDLIVWGYQLLNFLEKHEPQRLKMTNAFDIQVIQLNVRIVNKAFIIVDKL